MCLVDACLTDFSAIHIEEGTNTRQIYYLQREEKYSSLNIHAQHIELPPTH